MKATTRRTLLGAVAASGAVSAASAQGTPVKQVHYREGRKPASTPLYSSAISYGNLVFISGSGVNTPSDAAGQTDRVLKSIEERLLLAGSSMENVVKCNVYLNLHFYFASGIPTLWRPSAPLLIGVRALSGRTEANTQWVKKKTSPCSSRSMDFSKSISRDRESPRMAGRFWFGNWTNDSD